MSDSAFEEDSREVKKVYLAEKPRTVKGDRENEKLVNLKGKGTRNQ